MTSTKFNIDLIRSFSLFKLLTRKPKPQVYKTHDYTRQQRDRYVFEPIDNYALGNMTGYGSSVKIGDRIILKYDSNIYTYRVEQIDYYLDPPDMWIALLARVTGLEIGM